MAENRKKKDQQKVPVVADACDFTGSVGDPIRRGGDRARLPVVIRFADFRIVYHGAEGAIRRGADSTLP